jgi:hypothetical protein
MNASKLSAFSGAALLVALIASPSALSQSFTFDFTSAGMTAVGTFEVTDGVAMDGTINVSGVPIEATPGTFTTAAGTLIPGTGVITDPNGDDLTFDNVVSLSQNPLLNGNGLAFASGHIANNEYQTAINLFGNGPGSYGLFVGMGPGEYVYNQSNGPLIVTEIPEPSIYAAVIGAAALALAFTCGRRRTAY